MCTCLAHACVPIDSAIQVRQMQVRPQDPLSVSKGRGPASVRENVPTIAGLYSSPPATAFYRSDMDEEKPLRS